jgi:ssDNA-binding Zn-finger/Zn-ribbon topoisomerase 1
MVLHETQKFKTKDGKPRKFYGCKRWPTCKGTHGAHPDGRPLGIPGDAETKEWRHRAHGYFDGAVKRLGKKDRYKVLQNLMNMTVDEAHIGRFDVTQCKELIRLLGY